MANLEALYLDLMKRCLTKSIYREPYVLPVESRAFVKRLVVKAFAARGIHLVRKEPFDLTKRYPVGHTMIGMDRLDNIQVCVEDVINRGVPGDLIETGVWRGGATIFMRAVLKAYGVTDRRVWVADSFEGFPPPNPAKYPHDTIDVTRARAIADSQLAQAVSLEEVTSNFTSYGLLDDQVRFLKGWFSETLPKASIKALAIARLDSGTYESTTDVLTILYPKLSLGGYLIVDDYGYWPSCRHAVDDYRKANGIRDEIRQIDFSGIFWQRTG